MDNRNFSNLGNHIMDSVQDAIDSMDFKQLNQTISDTVNFALDEAKSQLEKARTMEYKYYERAERWKTEKASPAEKPGYQAFKTSRGRREETSCEKVQRAEPEGVKLCQPGRVSGILYTVFGSLGLGTAILILFVVWILALILKPAIWAAIGASLFLLAFGGGFTFMLHKGVSMRDQLKRARIYAKQAGKRMYCSIEELAAHIGRSKEFVLKDLQRMLERGIFPEGHLDEQKTCLILDNATYRQYQECQKALKERERQAAIEEVQKTEGPDSGRLEQMMAEGRNYLRILREANEAIPGEVISRKISNLENVIRKIFQSVEKHPEQMEEMERFMEYYLPTTVKLVNAYRDFDSTGTDGANISSAKEEIEGTLDTINQAFERLLDNLYQEAALDITTDASVLQTMLKKDGWAESDFTGGMKHE